MFKFFANCFYKKKPNQQITNYVQQFNEPICKNLTVDVIDACDDWELFQVVFDNICDSITDDSIEVLSRMTKGQQAIYSIWWIEAEVYNGGFNQYFFNPSCRFSEMAIEGFKHVNAPKYEKLMRQANDIYLKNKKNLAGYDNGTAEFFSQSYEERIFEECDTEFYKLDTENPMRLYCVKYIRENVQEFL